MAEPLPRTAWSELLWSAWSALGVNGWHGAIVDTVVDPEALVVATLAWGDERLIGETVTWATRRVEPLAPARVRYIARGELSHLADDWLDEIEGSGTRVSEATDPPQDRGLGSAGAALRWRAAAGAGARAEIIRAFHSVVVGIDRAIPSSEIVHRSAVSRPRANVVLDELVRAGLLQRAGSVRRRTYAPATADAFSLAMWSMWRHHRYAPWRELPSITGGLARVQAALQRGGVQGAVDARAAHQDVGAALSELRPDLVIRLVPSDASGTLQQVAAAHERVVPELADWYLAGRRKGSHAGHDRA